MSSLPSSLSPSRTPFANRTNAPMADAAVDDVDKTVAADTTGGAENADSASYEDHANPEPELPAREIFPSWGAYPYEGSAASEVYQSGFLPKGQGTAGCGYVFDKFSPKDEHLVSAQGVIIAQSDDDQLFIGRSYAQFQYETPDGVVDVVYDLDPLPHDTSAPDTRYPWHEPDSDEEDAPGHDDDNFEDGGEGYDPDYPPEPPGAHFRLEMPYYADLIRYAHGQTVTPGSGQDDADGAGDSDADCAEQDDADGAGYSGTEHSSVEGDLGDGDRDDDDAQPSSASGEHAGWAEPYTVNWEDYYDAYRASSGDGNADRVGDVDADDAASGNDDEDSGVDDPVISEALGHYSYDPAYWDRRSLLDAEAGDDAGDTDSASASDVEEDTEDTLQFVPDDEHVESSA